MPVPAARVIADDVAALAGADPDLARAAVVAGDFTIPLRPPGFATPNPGDGKIPLH